MQYKIISIIPKISTFPKTWEIMLNKLGDRVAEMRIRALSAGNTYSIKLLELEEIILNPDPKNIQKLMDDSYFLARKLPTKKDIKYLYFAENHMAIIELTCLIQNLKACWNKIDQKQKDILIKNILNFLINKTNETLNPNAAPCFSEALRDTIYGLIEFQPQLEQFFDELIEKRIAYNQEHPTRRHLLDKPTFFVRNNYIKSTN